MRYVKNLRVSQIVPWLKIHSSWARSMLHASNTGFSIAHLLMIFSDGAKSTADRPLLSHRSVTHPLVGTSTDLKQYPIDFNTLVDFTAPYSDSIYMLLKSPFIGNYTICQMRSFLNPDCSSRYNVSGSTNAAMEAHCEDPIDKMAYHRLNSNASIDEQIGYRDILTPWAIALSLNTGITDQNASIARQLNQFIVTTPSLNATLPSLAEALAALSGCTLLLSATQASFLHFFDEVTGYRPFHASVSSQEYTSGPQLSWQNAFYIILALVFLANIICLLYFLWKSGLVTDYTEPQNLFALAVNSPPSGMLSGACGAGPHGKQLLVGWKVRCEEAARHFYIAPDGTSARRSGIDLGGLGQGAGLGLGSSVELRSRSTFRPSLGESENTSYSKLSEQPSRVSWL